MRVNPIFDRMFKRVYGRPCWGVKNWYGSGIHFEFGKPHLVIREPKAANPKASRRVRELFAKRQVFVHGEWHLCINVCDWEIYQNAKRVGTSRSRASNLQRIVNSLSGQKLIGFSIRARGVDCVFRFELGGLLVTHASGTNSDYDQWNLFEPSGFCLTLRDDKRFAYRRSDEPFDEGPWKHI